MQLVRGGSPRANAVFAIALLQAVTLYCQTAFHAPGSRKMALYFGKSSHNCELEENSSVCTTKQRPKKRREIDIYI